VRLQGRLERLEAHYPLHKPLELWTNEELEAFTRDHPTTPEFQAWLRTASDEELRMVVDGVMPESYSAGRRTAL